MVDLQRRFRLWRLLILVWGLTVLSCGGESPPSNVIARSAYGETTVADLETYVLSLPGARRQPAQDQELVEWRREILEEMLVMRRLEEEATEEDLLATDEGQFFVESRWEPLLTARVRDRRVNERVQVTDEELRQFYDDHPEEFGHGPQIRVRNIYKRTTRQATPAERETARREIEELHRQLGEGASFIELARSHSDSETAQLDGLIGRLDPGALGPKVDRIVWALGEGEISEVVSTPVGFHIFKVDQRIEPFHMEFAEARTRLRRRFERLETEETLAEYLTELLEASDAHYDPNGLDGPDDTILFALGDLELTRGTFLERVFNLGFNQQRAMPLAEHLEQAVTRELYRWEAERLNLGDEPDLVAQLEQIEQTARVELAYRHRRRVHVENLEDAVLRSYFEENAARFQSPRLPRLRLLVRQFGAEGREWFELYEELERLAAGIRSGELDFAVEASRWSQDISASRGGDSGWINPKAIGDWAGPRASNAILALTMGEVSDPILIESYDDNRLLYEREGYMLVRVEEVRAAADPTFDEVRDKVAEHFVINGSEDLEGQIRREVLEEIGATIFQDHL